MVKFLRRCVHRARDHAQNSVERARLDAERRTLERQRAAALQDLGDRVSELERSGTLTDSRLGAHIATIREREMRLEATAERLTAVNEHQSARAA